MPNVAEVNDTLGWVYYKKDQAALAIPPLLLSVGQDRSNPVFPYHLGLAYAKDRDKVKALESFDEALRRNPNFREATEARLDLNLKN